MDRLPRTILETSVGAVAGSATYRTWRRLGSIEGLSAVCLVTAALTYPLTDLRSGRGPARTRELAALGATLAVGLGSAFLPTPTRRRILAAGWLSHAGFDAAHRRNSGSRLPFWYPAFCAGFDVVVAAGLMKGA